MRISSYFRSVFLYIFHNFIHFYCIQKQKGCCFLHIIASFCIIISFSKCLFMHFIQKFVYKTFKVPFAPSKEARQAALRKGQASFPTPKDQKHGEHRNGAATHKINSLTQLEGRNIGQKFFRKTTPQCYFLHYTSLQAQKQANRVFWQRR